MSSQSDNKAAIGGESNHATYLAMRELEATSSFSLQGTPWLGDLAPHLLINELNDQLARAKEIAKLREKAEVRIPKHLLYVKGWPTVKPTADEPLLIAEVRCEVAELLSLEICYRNADSMVNRFAGLMTQKEGKWSCVPPARSVPAEGDPPCLRKMLPTPTLNLRRLSAKGSMTQFSG